jgi:hypothetical protein
MPFPFELPFSEVQENIDSLVDEVFGALQSEFLTMPKGDGFIEYPVFEQGYEALKKATHSFRELSSAAVLATVRAVPVSFIVLRSMLGFTPPEWTYAATQSSQTEVPQGAARALDRNIRMKPLEPIRLKEGGVTKARVEAMVVTACELLAEGAPADSPALLHRLNKADTKAGLVSIQPFADIGVPYAMLLYERFLGRPFAGHRDSVSELVGGVLENAIEEALVNAGISHRKTKRAERVEGFDQAPDFIIPDEFAPKVVIEAKLTEDDGTARDKITRVQHLGSLSVQGVSNDTPPRFEVVACIAGRGFKVRREDMKKLLLATRGKVFTLQNLGRLIECTSLSQYRSK